MNIRGDGDDWGDWGVGSRRMLVGLGFLPGVGKSDIAQVMQEDFGFVKYEVSEPAKSALLRLNPLVNDDTLSVPVKLRELFAESGENWDALLSSNGHVRSLLNRFQVETIQPMFGAHVWSDLALRRSLADYRVVFTDVRQADTFHMIRRHNGLLVRVENPNSDSLFDPKVDAELYSADWDIVAVNDDGPYGVQRIGRSIATFAKKPEMWSGTETELVASRLPDRSDDD